MFVADQRNTAGYFCLATLQKMQYGSLSGFCEAQLAAMGNKTRGLIQQNDGTQLPQTLIRLGCKDLKGGGNQDVSFALGSYLLQGP